MWTTKLSIALLLYAGYCEGRKRNVIDTCVIIGENVSRTDIMASFRLANEDVLDKLSPPLRLAINQTDIYKESDSYDNTKFGMCFFIASSSSDSCRVPPPQDGDTIYDFDPFCLTTVTGHVLINTKGMICHPRPLNVAVIKLPEKNKTNRLENIIASMVLYKMGITVSNNETEMVLPPGSPNSTWSHEKKLDSNGNRNRTVDLVGPDNSWWNQYTERRIKVNGTFRCLWTEDVMEHEEVISSTVATTTSTTTTPTKTTTTTTTASTAPSTSTSTDAPATAASDTKFPDAGSAENVTPSMIKAEANMVIKTDYSSTTAIISVISVMFFLAILLGVGLLCKKRRNHSEEKGDTEKIMDEGNQLSEPSHEVNVDSALVGKTVQFNNSGFSSSSGESPVPVTPGNVSVSSTPV